MRIHEKSQKRTINWNRVPLVKPFECPLGQKRLHGTQCVLHTYADADIINPIKADTTTTTNTYK